MKFTFDKNCRLDKDIEFVEDLINKKPKVNDNINITPKDQPAKPIKTIGDNKIPFHDMNIYMLIRKGKRSFYDRLCTNKRLPLMLEPIYECENEVKMNFILIDLSEIHGKWHLTDVIKYLKS